MISTFEQNDGVSRDHDEESGAGRGSGRDTLEGMCACCAPRWGSHHSPQWDSAAKNSDKGSKELNQLWLERAKSVIISQCISSSNEYVALDLMERHEWQSRSNCPLEWIEQFLQVRS